jgi:hypothetical protein
MISRYNPEIEGCYIGTFVHFQMVFRFPRHFRLSEPFAGSPGPGTLLAFHHDRWVIQGVLQRHSSNPLFLRTVSGNFRNNAVAIARRNQASTSGKPVHTSLGIPATPRRAIYMDKRGRNR